MQFLPIALVDEDPDQPRRTFDEASLRELGEDMKANGQLQPVGVVPGEGGRYTLKFGARRLRACRAAGIPRIAYVLAQANHGVAAQVAENQQRQGLSNTDLSAAVARLTADGMKNKEIARVAGLKEYELKYYRQLTSLPAFLKPWTDRADARALTELAQAWEKHEAARDAIEVATSENGPDLTVAAVRRIIEATTGHVIQSFDKKKKAGQLVQTEEPKQEREAGQLVQGPAPEAPDSAQAVTLKWIIKRSQSALKNPSDIGAFDDIVRKISELGSRP